MTATRRRLLAALPALLAGCAAPSRPAAVGDTPPPDEAMEVAPGVRLPVRVWRPPGPVAANVLALHGFNDSRDAWEYPAPMLADAGFAVYAPDQRGFGGAPGRGTWPGTEALVADALACLNLLRRRDPGTPLFLMGESMGGAVAMLVAAAPAPVAGTVLLSPAVWGRRTMSPVLTGALWIASHLAPGYRVTGQEIAIKVRPSDNQAALHRLATDPLTLRGSTLRGLRGLVDLMDAALDAAPRMPANTLFLYGERDRIVPQVATAELWRHLPPAASGGPRRALYRDGYHLLLRDDARALPTGDVIAWMRAPARPLPSGAEGTAAAWLLVQA